MDQDNIGDRDFKYAFTVMLSLVALAILLVLIG